MNIPASQLSGDISFDFDSLQLLFSLVVSS